MKHTYSSKKTLKRAKPAGFTLVEIMIVVVIVGLLALMAVPKVQEARKNAYKSRLLNDYRQFRSAFETYSMDVGAWPDDAGPGILPPEMEGYIVESKFEEPTVVQGNWDWEGPGAFAFTAGISLRDTLADTTFMEVLDESLDDGNLTSGTFRSISSGTYTLILEE